MLTTILLIVTIWTILSVLFVKWIINLRHLDSWKIWQKILFFSLNLPALIIAFISTEIIKK